MENQRISLMNKKQHLHQASLVTCGLAALLVSLLGLSNSSLGAIANLSAGANLNCPGGSVIYTGPSFHNTGYPDCHSGNTPHFEWTAPLYPDVKYTVTLFTPDGTFS